MKRKTLTVETITYELDAHDVRQALKAYVKLTSSNETGRTAIIADDAELQLCADGTAILRSRYSVGEKTSA